ncbi:hypothetical protein IVB45_02175 [Bradyrhizobium sp. 4]|uniref:hypothetical protein n=1 Tax=Bradyrhizobium sp. 4 TaxID=2782678 RepID=UPI001FFF270C|nr:hypothetical protein [Bradyrhizobium sp. 4]UPJ35841.1 hypothetical protein IVB45_02175 [Bradyrhizobium sp. 4]
MTVNWFAEAKPTFEHLVKLCDHLAKELEITTAESADARALLRRAGAFIGVLEHTAIDPAWLKDAAETMPENEVLLKMITDEALFFSGLAEKYFGDLKSELKDVAH